MPDKINNNILNKLQKKFKIGWKKGKDKNNSEIYPLEKKQTVDTSGNKKVDWRELKFDDKSQKLFNYWMNSCHDNAESWKNRKELWQDMELLYYNAPLVAKAVDITTDEVIQADNNNQIVFVEGNKKIKDFVLDFFDKINLNEILRPTIHDIILYGNAGWILGFDNEGVSEVIPININSLVDRLEFTPFEVEKKIKSDKSFKRYSKYDRVQDLINSILDKNNVSSYFKKYLFGYQIEDAILPPWKFLHFRNYTTKSPFAPFGVPAFICSLAPYRQLDAVMGMYQVAKGMSLPVEVYKLNLPNVVDPATKLAKAHEFISELQNSGFGLSKKESMGMGEIKVTIQDLYEYELKSADIDLDKLGDAEILLEALKNSIPLPRNLIDPSDGSFGDSGISLIEQFKPFARTVYRYQSIVLQQLTQLVKIHAIYSNKFEDEDELDFILSMKYPESQTNSDVINSQQDLIDLAGTIIDTLKDRITGGTDLPPEMIKDIYMQFLPYDQERIEKWINDSVKFKNTLENEDSDDGFKFESIKKWKQLEERCGKQKLKESVKDIIFEHKFENIKERSLGGKHYYSSRVKDMSFDATLLTEFDKSAVKELKEKFNKNINSTKIQDIENAIDETRIKEYVFDKEKTLKEVEETKGKKHIF